ncbi:MAG: alpha-galactosidase [Leptospiraceae bacterium]|nr:alpha-galactosidase [Leptospiraceae bacterium]
MPVFEDYSCHVIYKRGGSLKEERFETNGIVRNSEASTFQIKDQSQENQVRIRLKQLSEDELNLERFELRLKNPSSLFPGQRNLRLFQHGYHSWSSCQVVGARDRDLQSRFRWKHDMDENPETPFPSSLPGRLHSFAKKGLFHSESVAAMISDSGKLLFLGQSDTGLQHVRFRIRLRPSDGSLAELVIVWDFNGQKSVSHAIQPLSAVRALESQETEEKFFNFLDRAYGEIARDLPDAPNRSANFTGWCSWYHYYTGINEENLAHNLMLLKAREVKLDVFQIDDGYQKNIGDWLQTNEKFPRGLAPLVKQIKKAGYRAGVWYAPFLARPDADLIRQHPEILLRNAKGRPVRALINPNWGGKTYALDVTHPKYLEYISRVTRHFIEQGFTYLKLDFLFTPYFRGRYYSPDTTGSMRLRKALETIRKAAGKKTFLLGCGCPLYPSIGIVDGQRVSMDVNHMWEKPLLGKLLGDRNFPALRPALQNNLLRSFMHQRLWLNDPDCLMLRNRETELTDAQIRLSAVIMTLVGGMILISDDLQLLDGPRFEWLEKILEINKKCSSKPSIPLEGLHNPFPLGAYNPNGYLGLWNPTDRPARIDVRLPAGLSPNDLKRRTDLFDGQLIPWTVSKESIKVSMAPYESFFTKLS